MKPCGDSVGGEVLPFCLEHGPATIFYLVPYVPQMVSTDTIFYLVLKFLVH